MRILLVIAAAVAGPVALQARTMADKLQAVCHAEIQILCPDRTPDDTKTCMLKKRERVSAACIKLIDASE